MKISKIDETYLSIDCDEKFSKKLVENFSFYKNGYLYDPAYKMGYSDGKIKLFDKKTKKIYHGLLDKVLEFSAKTKEPVEFDFNNSEQSFSNEEAETFLESLDLPFRLHEHQFKAFVECVRKRRLLSEIAVNGGKTLLMYILARYYTKARIIIIVPFGGLLKQLRDDFIEYGLPPGEISILKKDNVKNVNRITIATWQLLKNVVDPNFFKKFTVLMGDEAHLLSAKIPSTCITKLVNCKHRFGFTGSLGDSDIDEMSLIGLFGNKRIFVDNEELIEKGISSNIKIKILILNQNYIESQLDEYRKIDEYLERYRFEINFIMNSEKRNKYIVDLAKSLKGNTVILFKEKIHGNILYESLINSLDEEVDVHYIDGQVSYDVRDKIRHEVNSSKKSFILASTKAFGTGTNIKTINNIIYAHPFKKEITIKQTIGRGLRICESKDKFTLYDLSDNIVNVKNCYGHKHLKERISLYKRENFEYKIFNINL